MLGDQLRLELAVAVARDLDFDLRVFGLDFLSGRTVAGVAAVAPRGVMLFIAEQLSQLAIEGVFNESREPSARWRLWTRQRAEGSWLIAQQ
jgi:hypothetical protein